MIHENRRSRVEILLTARDTFPELRLGQLIDNALYESDDLFYISDQELSNRLEEYVTTFGTEPDLYH